MGSYTFSWEHAAEEVFVTGDFDAWQKTVKLEKEDGIFKKTLELPKAKHLYKFFVDGNWATNDSAPGETDSSGNYNNVLTPDDIKESVATLSSAAPESTTAALAAAVPKEDSKSKSDESIPGAFPLTPPVETPSNEPIAFSVNPIPATEGLGNPIQLAPGEKVPDPSTLTSNTVDSTVKHEPEPEPEEAKVSVAPIPATAELGNPIQLAPGEKVPDPSTLTSNTIDSTVKHEPEPEPEEAKVSVAPIPATAGLGNPIHLEPGEPVPDPSSLTSNTISSTAKTDPESYEKSNALPPQLGPVVTPEAERDANGGMFGLPPVTSNLIPESSLPSNTEAKTEKDPGVTIQSAAPTSTTAALAAEVPLEPKAVPETVTESQKEAGFTPEASANPEAVQEKKEVEQELVEKVPEAPPAAESSTTEQVGATAAAGVTATAGAFAAATYAAKEKAAETVGLNGQATASEVPEVVTESQKEAHASPEASANPEAVEEKKQVESELLKEVKKVDEAAEPAPTVTAATTETAPAPSEAAPADSKPAVPETAQPVSDSRDVSPMSKQPTTAGQTGPAVTTGVETTATDAKTTTETPTPKDSAAPESAKDVPESNGSGAADKKKKRRSIFGKLKDKFSSKS